MTPKNGDKGGMAKPPRVASVLGSEDLIHRNNSPESMFMRLPGRFRLLPTTPVLEGIRKAIYVPLELARHLPGGPVRHLLWLRYVAFFLVFIDKPFRSELLRRRDANATTT